MRPAFAVILGIMLFIIVCGVFYNWKQTGTLSGHGYSKDDVTRVEQSIRTELSKENGFKVEEVTMILESPKKMTGFVKLQTPFGSIHKSCTSILGDDATYVWECK